MNRPTPRFPILCAVTTAAFILVVGIRLQAQESLADVDSFRKGCQSLADQRYQTASEHFSETWDLLNAQGSGETEKNFVASRLLESLVLNGSTEEAVSWIRKNELLRPSSQTLRWVARALQAEEFFKEATEYYALLNSSLPRPERRVIVNHAICLARDGQGTRAFDLIEPLPANPSPQELLTFAKIAVEAGKFSEARSYLESSEQAPGADRFASERNRLSTWVLWKAGRVDEAVSGVVDSILDSKSPEAARKAFLLLEAMAPNLSNLLESELSAIRDDKSHPAHEAFRLFSILHQFDPEERETELRKFYNSAAPTPLRTEAKIRLLQFGTEEEEVEEDFASSIPPRLVDRLTFAESVAHFRNNEYDEAIENFSQSAAAANGDQKERRLFNAAISALKAGAIGKFTVIRKRLGEIAPESKLLPDLDYLGGLFYASKGDPQAFDLLNSFVQRYPDHPNSVDAQLALAEIQLNQAPARPQAARDLLALLQTRPLDLLQTERFDYISIWIEKTENNPTEMIRLATSFVRDWPSSNYRSEIAMLLATELYTQRQFEKAREYFDLIADTFSESSNAETARFLAAKSSPNNEETIAQWKEIAEGGGPFADQAWHELALLNLNMDRFQESRNILERLSEDPEIEPALQQAVKADLGFTWYSEALANGKDPEMLEKASGTFAELSQSPSTPRHWKYSAAIRRAKCLEALDKSIVALEIYRSIVDEAQSNSSILEANTSPKEVSWVFRAGFSAIEIMAENEDWKGAIQMADTLSEKDGPRAIEAAQLAEKLRLKHWVWE